MFSLYCDPQLGICIRRASVLPIQDGVPVKIYGKFPSCWAAMSRCFHKTVLESDSSCEQESPAAMELQENDENTGNER